MSDVLVIGVWLDIYVGTGFPEHLNVVAPLKTQTKPSPLNCDVVYAF